MFFFINFERKKKDMIVQVHENHDKWPYVTAVHHFCRGLDHANIASSFRGSKYFTKNLIK